MVKTYSILFLIIAILFISCNKGLNERPFDSTHNTFISEAQNWLKVKGQKFSDESISLEFNEKMKTTNSAISLADGKLNWELAKFKPSVEDEILIVPFTFNNASYSKNKRIIKGNESGELPLMINLYLKKDKLGNIEGAIQMEAYKDDADKSKRQIFSSIYSLKMKHLIERLIDNAGIHPVTIKDETGLKTSMQTIGDNCEDLSYTISYIEYCTGSMETTACYIKKKTIHRYRCWETNPQQNEETVSWIDNSDQGGSWETYEEEEEEVELANKRIIDSLQGYPCAQEVLAELPTCNDLTSNILQSVFGVNDKVNIIFKADASLPSETNGQTSSIYWSSGIKFEATIKLNATYLQQAPKEFIVKTVLHESIHAFLEYQWSRYTLGFVDSTTFKSEYPLIWEYKNNAIGHHEQMAQSYIDALINIIGNFNPYTSMEMKRALAWNGLNKTEAWRRLGADTTQLKDLYFAGRNKDPETMNSNNLTTCDE